MKSNCTNCNSELSEMGKRKGYCSVCEYEFNPKHAQWVIESPKLYSGTFIGCDGYKLSISKMAEHRLSGKILKIFGIFAVTTDGIECLDLYYFIPSNRLKENWIEHMEEKTWVKMNEFKAALNYAKKIHMKN